MNYELLIKKYMPVLQAAQQSDIDLVHFGVDGGAMHCHFYNLRKGFLKGAVMTPLVTRCVYDKKDVTLGSTYFTAPRNENNFSDIAIYTGYNPLDISSEVAVKYWNLSNSYLSAKMKEDVDFCTNIFETIFPKNRVTFEDLNDFTRYSIENGAEFIIPTSPIQAKEEHCLSLFDGKLYAMPKITLRKWQKEGGAIRIDLPERNLIHIVGVDVKTTKAF